MHSKKIAPSSKYERRVSIVFVEKEMFIARLDRPWRETPFWLQGFLLKTDEELNAIREYCRSVYIDISRGSPAEFYMEEDLELPTHRNIEKRILQKKQHTRYRNSVPLQEEITQARNILEEASELFQVLIDDLKQHEPFLSSDFYQLAEPLINSIMRNCDALPLLCRLKGYSRLKHDQAIDSCVSAILFGRFLSLPLSQIRSLAVGALLLDIGKISLPDELLSKQGVLSNHEMALVYTHVEYGLQILVQDDDIEEDIVNMVRTHHEKNDGSGYPNGLVEERIPAFGRIAAIIDSYHAMCSYRPYNDILTPHAALQTLYSEHKAHFQSELIDKFISCLGMYPDGSLVEFKNGTVGLVLAQNYKSRLNPLVLMLLDERKKPYSEFTLLNLEDNKKDPSFTIIKDLQPGDYEINLQTIYQKLDTVFERFHLEAPLINPPQSIIDKFMFYIEDQWQELRQKLNTKKHQDSTD